MEKEQLNEELTEEVAGGVDAKSYNKKDVQSIFKPVKIDVKCAKCERKFGYVIDEGPLEIIAAAYWKRQRRRRTCPHCGYVNSEKELGI